MYQLAGPVTEWGRGENAAPVMAKSSPGDDKYAKMSPARRMGTHVPPPGKGNATKQTPRMTPQQRGGCQFTARILMHLV